MPTPTIPDGELFMNATLWTGNGGTQTITNGAPGQAFQPDLVWYKSRSNSGYDHYLEDSVRGATKWIGSSSTSAELTIANSLTSFNSNGFTLGSDAGGNQNTLTYVGWQWKAGGTAVTNTAGTISAQVSANTTAGFSVVTYTGPGAGGGTVGHGLGVAPSMIIVKNRSAAESWRVYHSALGGTRYINLNSTAAAATDGSVWNNTNPTSTVFSIANDSAVSGSGNGLVAYCWAQIAGYSAFGSYTGNGSTDGPFVYTNFQPRYVMTKRTDSSSNWYIQDTSRSTYNLQKATLFAESSSAEAADGGIDFLSNGFKLRNTDSSENASGGTYIYMAFASNPFKYSNAR